MKHPDPTVPTEPVTELIPPTERETLGRIVRYYFGGLGGLSWEELGPERQQCYLDAGEAVARYVRARMTPRKSGPEAK